ncbi:MAG: hypothetical protein VX624_09575, partial [Pseudomonadota bacterium]|nr:hypothetical protein [Pseudomonadota bacterium]
MGWRDDNPVWTSIPLENSVIRMVNPERYTARVLHGSLGSVDRGWSYFALIAASAVVLWVWHRRHEGRQRSLVPVVVAII